MTTIPDQDVDAIYRRGVADLVAHAGEPVARNREMKPRRVPIFAAIVAFGVPFGALAWSAFAIIGGHAKSATLPHPTQATSPIPAAKIGEAFRVSDSSGLVAVVTVEKLTYATVGRGGAQPPQNGFYAVANVLISTTSAIGNTVSAQEFNNAEAQLNIQLSILAMEKVDNDMTRELATQNLIDLYTQNLSLLAQQLMPFTFTYETSHGRTFAASSGNALESGFDPMLLAVGGLPKGLTYGNIVFDVPSKGGVIQMTDPFSGVVGRWRLPVN
ncbi:MAG: hypothetical protein ABSC35_11040 [Candidatus Dormibacteria bacterium]|jgi:hypothetical protein